MKQQPTRKLDAQFSSLIRVFQRPNDGLSQRVERRLTSRESSLRLCRPLLSFRLRIRVTRATPDVFNHRILRHPPRHVHIVHSRLQALNRHRTLARSNARARTNQSFAQHPTRRRLRPDPALRVTHPHTHARHRFSVQTLDDARERRRRRV